MLALIDYGMGNIRSVYKAFEYIGAPVKLIGSADELNAIDDIGGIVLPGVGAFGDCMKNLGSRGFVPLIKEKLSKGVPYLGICLGFQILFGFSEESSGIPGLGIFNGTNKRFPDTFKVPHMGWNHIKKTMECPYLDKVSDGKHFYFVHSYYVDCKDSDLTATVTEYGISFTSSICKDKIFACQFHPEKSQDAGLQILRRFVELCI